MYSKLKRQRHLREKLALVARSLYVPVTEDQNIVLVGSAHKVGSTWLYELVRDLGGYRLPLMRLPKSYFEHGVLKLEKTRIEERLDALRGRVIFKTHSAPIDFDNPNIRLVSIFRDPRDVLVSSAFYLANLEEARGGWGETFNALGIEGRLIKLIEDGEFIVRKLEQWFYAQYVFKVSYEELLRDPEPAVRKLAGYLKLNVSDEHISAIIEEHKFKNRARPKKAGQDNSKLFLRKGIAGDWRNHFTDKAIAAYKSGMDGRWGHILIDMGYETTPDWSIDNSR